MNIQYAAYQFIWFLCVLYLSPLKNCFWVQGLGFSWVILVGFDPAYVLTPPETPLS